MATIGGILERDRELSSVSKEETTRLEPPLLRWLMTSQEPAWQKRKQEETKKRVVLKIIPGHTNQITW